MKKRLFTVFLAGLLLLQTVAAFAEAKHMILNGVEVEFPEGMGSIREMDDRTFVPVRFITEFLGCHVNYNEVQESVTVTDENRISYLIIKGEKDLYVLDPNGSGKVITMDTAAFIVEGEDRMYVPIRFLAEALGYVVGWDEATETVSMNRPTEETSPIDPPDASLPVEPPVQPVEK